MGNNAKITNMLHVVKTVVYLSGNTKILKKPQIALTLSAPGRRYSRRPGQRVEASCKRSLVPKIA
jgi:hypothetical protein